MKYVIAIIQPHKLDHIRDALVPLGITSLTTTEVRRFGSNEEHVEFFRAAEQKIGFLPKVKIEFAVSDEMMDRAVDAVRDAATTGNIGDGRIYVLELARTVQIKSGRVDAEVAML